MLADVRVYAPIPELKSRLDAIAVALVSEDGQMLQSALPTGVYADSFAVMCATIVGAAATVSSDLKRTPPDHIVIRGPDFTTILARYDRSRLLATVVGPGADVEKVVGLVDEFIVTYRPPETAP